MHITTEKAKEIIRVTILTRAGAVITPELAEERARNCAAALSDCTIGEPGDLLKACEAAADFIDENTAPFVNQSAAGTMWRRLCLAIKNAKKES